MYLHEDLCHRAGLFPFLTPPPHARPKTLESVCIYLFQCFSTGEVVFQLLLRGHLPISGDIFGCYNCLGGELLASGGGRPGTQLDNPQRTGHPTPRLMQPQTLTVPRLENHSIPVCTWGIYLLSLQPAFMVCTCLTFFPSSMLSARHLPSTGRSPLLLLCFHHLETLHTGTSRTAGRVTSQVGNPEALTFLSSELKGNLLKKIMLTPLVSTDDSQWETNITYSPQT